MRSSTDERRRVVEHFFVLDFDRCLGNTTALQMLLEEIVIQMTTITREQLRAAQVATEETGGSFDTVRYVQEKLHENDESVAWKEIADRFIAEGRQRDMLEPGARELLDLLHAHRIPHGIMTYGGALWQAAKLQASRLDDTPSLTITSKDKGRLLAQWRRGEEFIIPPELAPYGPLVAQHLTLIDDKAVSFDDLPEGADGLYVLPVRGQTQLASQQGRVPASVVTTVRGLEEALVVVRTKIEMTNH